MSLNVTILSTLTMWLIHMLAMCMLLTTLIKIIHTDYDVKLYVYNYGASKWHVRVLIKNCTELIVTLDLQNLSSVVNIFSQLCEYFQLKVLL